MRDQEAIDLLENADRPLAAKWSRWTLVGFELIDDQLDLPPAMIGQDEITRWSGRRIHQ
jgi:hypothetical protein